MLAGLYYATAGEPDFQRMMRLVLGEATRRPALADAFARAGPQKVLGFLRRYLDRQVELGRLRPHDTRSSAKTFMGMLLPQVMARALFPALLEDGLPDDEHGRTCVDIFLNGLRPEEGEE